MYNLTDPFIIQTPRLITSAYAQHRGPVRLLKATGMGTLLRITL